MLAGLSPRVVFRPIFRLHKCHIKRSSEWRRIYCFHSRTLSQRAGQQNATNTDNVNLINDVNGDLQGIHQDINHILDSKPGMLQNMCCYYFDGKGKSIRPRIVFLVSRAFNYHNFSKSFVSEDQRKVALISEMIHVGSLIHDDVVDFSDVRRGKMSVNSICGDRKALMAGNFVVSNASRLLSSIGNANVTVTISQVIEDIVRGEFMQQDNQGSFNQYLKKTYKKTASLVANCCKAAVQLSSSEAQAETAFEFGRNLGIAFQLVDDLLDFVSTSESLGKPTAADLKLGLATAPVLFASEKHPLLHDMILRRFQHKHDVEEALKLVANSGAIEDTRLLATQYCHDAVRCLEHLKPSPEKDALIQVTDLVVNRSK
uniref:Decaprenyl-diphosphate synthase subunit 1-like n=1 Tax=Phallusia mammillata TaxID=59560 RepID=A0A6F9DP52_9ASCI|nr:decaprenyl-diphosphate synthase subunit 1-like [Phallusia mammillata]